MNQVFNFNRWLLLTGKHWSENRKKYLLALLAIAGVLFVWFAFLVLMERDRPMNNNMQVSTYFVGLYVVGALFASLLFADLSSTPKAINYLSVPASAFEKLLVSLLFGLILFFIFYTIVFYLVDFTMVKVADNLRYSRWLAFHNPGDGFEAETIVNVFVRTDNPNGYNPPHNPNFYFILIFVALQSAFTLGSVYFPTYSFIKTSVAISVIILIAIFFARAIAETLVPNRANLMSFTSYVLRDGEDSYRVVRLPVWIDSILLFLFKYSAGPILWIVTYFRLKEKEV